MFITMYFPPTNEKPEINGTLKHRCTELYSPNKWFSEFLHHSVQFSSVAQSCLTLWNPMNRSTWGFPVHHQLPESTQTHVHESVMPSNYLFLCRPLLLKPSIFPSIRVFQMSQLFASRGQSIGVSASTSILPMNTQDWPPLGWTDWISLQSKGLPRVFSCKLKTINSSVLSFLYSPTLTSIQDY